MTDLAPWRSPLAKALHLNRAIPHGRYIQLATVRPNRSPANRTVVFRGFVPQSNQLTAITDRRSQKIQEIQANPSAEICWYFPKTREQFRINGWLQTVDAQHPQPDLQQTYFQTWQNLSEAARSQFYNPTPREPYPANWTAGRSPSDTEKPPETFVLLVLTPMEVEHLELSSHPHRVHAYHLETQTSPERWSKVQLTP